MISENTDVGITCIHVRTTSGPCSCAAAVKVKFTLEQATKAHRGSKGIALLFL